MNTCIGRSGVIRRRNLIIFTFAYSVSMSMRVVALWTVKNTKFGFAGRVFSNGKKSNLTEFYTCHV